MFSDTLGDHGREPAGQVVDVGRAGPVEADPGLLYGIVRFGERAEHAGGNRAQVGPVLLELLRLVFHGLPFITPHAALQKTRWTGGT